MSEVGHPEHADDEVLSHHDKFYIQATSSRTDDRTRVLKHGRMFAVFDRHGDVQPVGFGEQGVDSDDTRFLSRLELRVGGRRPLLLSSTVKRERFPRRRPVEPRPQGGGRLAHPGARRAACLSQHLSGMASATSGCGSRASAATRSRSICGWTWMPISPTSSRCAAPSGSGGGEAARGDQRGEPGVRLRGARRGDAVDAGQLRSSAPVPLGKTGPLSPFAGAAAVGDAADRHRLRAGGGGPSPGDARACPGGAHRRARQRRFLPLPHPCHQRRSRRVAAPVDLRPADDDHQDAGRSYPYAGVPWFSTPFGRDGILTAMEVLWIAPEIARGVLGFLAATQATETAGARRAAGEDPARGAGRRDGRPSRGAVRALLRQRRRHAALRDAGGGVPAPHRRRRLRSHAGPHVDRALAWIERDGDADGDGFVEYARQTDKGLVQQGWKDAHDSVFHADGTLAEGPIALCEVQGYVYGAFRGATEIARARASGPRRGLPAQGAAAARALRRDVLGRDAGDVRAGARRHEAPLSGPQLERRARALGPGLPSRPRRAARPRR